jgi:hypothetical protein
MLWLESSGLQASQLSTLEGSIKNQPGAAKLANSG